MDQHAIWTTIKFCIGTILLLLVALLLNSFQAHSPGLSQALSPQQSAAAWWSQYPNYEIGWPVSHAYSGGISAGWCNRRFNNCPLPSYADIYVTDNPSQPVVAKVSQAGYYFGFAPYDGPIYTSPNGSIPTLAAGTSVTLEWACQNFQSQSYNYPGTCNNFDIFGNCIGNFPNTSGTYTYYDYGSVLVNGVSTTTMVGGLRLYPSHTTTYTVSCVSAGWSPSPMFGVPPMPTTPDMSFTVNVTPVDLPTATLDAGAGNGKTLTAHTGSPVTITAQYNWDTSKDTLVSTAINGSNQPNVDAPSTSVNCATVTPSNASCWTQPDGQKQYTFTPTAPGTYTFYAAVKTGFYGWNNYKSVSVVVKEPCLNGDGDAGACTSCNQGYTLSGNIPVTTKKYLTLGSGTSWTVFSDWNNSNNSVEVIGGGGGGQSAAGGGGGGGGAYAKKTNVVLSSPSVKYAVGAGGPAGNNGGDTYFCNAANNCSNINDSAVEVGAKGGSGSTGNAGGAGGSAGNSKGPVTKAGGAGGAGGISSNTAGGGGGGAAGPNGTGGTGGKDDASNGSGAGGAGGGGNGGGTAGESDPKGGGAGAGGTNSGGTGAGKTGGYKFGSGTNVQATNGGGGFGGTAFDALAAHVATFIHGGAGGAGTEWDASHGSGGGGGGGASDYPPGTPTPQGNGGAGGNYGGGGGGGSTAGAGAPGLIVITNTVGSNFCVPNACAGGQINPPQCTDCGPLAAPDSNGVCVPTQCSDPHASGYPTCACTAPYTGPNGGPCTLSAATPTLSLTSVHPRVAKGAPAVVNYKAQGVGAGTTCGISSNPSSVLSLPMPAGTTGIWQGTVSTIGITRTATLTLSCSGGATPATITVGLLPGYKEN